jgi:hypothetical protein
MRQMTNVYDIHGIEIGNGDIVRSDLGTTYLILWDREQQEFVAQIIDEWDEQILAVMQQYFGLSVRAPRPFSRERSQLGFEDYLEIVGCQWPPSFKEQPFLELYTKGESGSDLHK